MIHVWGTWHVSCLPNRRDQFPDKSFGYSTPYYVPHTVLCAEYSEKNKALVALPGLKPVSQGAHYTGSKLF